MKRHKPKPQSDSQERNWNKFRLTGTISHLRSILEGTTTTKQTEIDNLRDAITKIQIVLANWEKV